MKNYKKFWKLGNKDFSTEVFDINKSGELVIREGNYQYRVLDLIKKFGTPLEIALPFVIENRLNNLFDVFNHYLKSYHYNGRFFYHYPMKVNQTREFVLPIISEGGQIEVASANELWLVKKLWEQDQFNAKIRVICNGPKTTTYFGLISDLRSRGLHVIPVIEDEDELAYFRKAPIAEVGIRTDIGKKVRSRWDHKFDYFGFSPKEILNLGTIKNLKLLHYHIGSQTTHTQDLVSLLREAMQLFIALKKKNPGLDIIDIGGGFPVSYEKRKTYSVDSVVNGLVRELSTITNKAKINPPDIVAEWGRYMVAPAQITIFKILRQKHIADAVAKKWYIIDGSFINDLTDTWSVHQKWHIVPVNNVHTKKLDRVWLAGLSCDSDDRYTEGGNYILIPSLDNLEEGQNQYIAVLDTGAYQDSLSSHHCLLSSPAKVIAQNGVLTLARKRESPEEIGKQFGW